MRGKRWLNECEGHCGGSIPACAGETTRHSFTGTRQVVYPRVCGGNALVAAGINRRKGLSPRVRGKLALGDPRFGERRSIPACAGETSSSATQCSESKVYPRVCGGNILGRGHISGGQGLSPRVRGKLLKAQGFADAARSIPACAGETAGAGSHPADNEVYPRVCGGNLPAGDGLAARAGLSPRVRGKPAKCRRAGIGHGSIPACAGETSPRREWRRVAAVYPRVCGGNLAPLAVVMALAGLSPRVRGKQVVAAAGRHRIRSIPACAGETATSKGKCRHPRVYPRVCGGNYESTIVDR